MKTKEELNVLREEVEILNKKLAELTNEELTQVTGGLAPGRKYWFCSIGAVNEPEIANFEL